jgi:hypothetical protein
MNEHELRRALARIAPDDAAARERSWRVVRAAYAERKPLRPRRRPGRALAIATVMLVVGAVGVAAAHPPHGGLGGWVRSVLGVDERHARPALIRVPGGGRLLVQAGGSAWIVSGDGSRRRLGAYSGASWSPRGRFVIAWGGRQLTAVDRRGRVRWSLTRPERIAVARWGPVDGFRIAYLAGSSLRIVNGDGTGDHRHARAVEKVAPAWRPDDAHVLAYADARKRVNVVAVDSRRRLWRTSPLPGIVALRWSPRGDRLLAVSRHGVSLFNRRGRRLASRAARGRFVARAVAWAPGGASVAVIRTDPAGRRSEAVVLDASRLHERVLFAGPGSFGGATWSPDGRHLLVAWPQADQWLFLRRRGGRRVTAVANVAHQLSPGVDHPRFPRSVEWCCGAPTRRRP